MVQMLVKLSVQQKASRWEHLLAQHSAAKLVIPWAMLWVLLREKLLAELLAAMSETVLVLP